MFTAKIWGMSMATCDECNGWLNPALAVDAAVKRDQI